MSLQVDRIKQNKIGWNSDYVNPNSQAYRVLEDESVYAVSIFFFIYLFQPKYSRIKVTSVLISKACRYINMPIFASNLAFYLNPEING